MEKATIYDYVCDCMKTNCSQCVNKYWLAEVDENE